MSTFRSIKVKYEVLKAKGLLKEKKPQVVYKK
jgi:hypothetical protein